MQFVSEPRPLGIVLWRGLLGRCPSCGKGRMFRAWLKVVDHCPECGEALHHHHADDLPPYLVILVVGHLIVGLVLWAEKAFQPSVVTHAFLWLPLTLGLCLGLLQPIKGAVVALQWYLGLHGFQGANARLLAKRQL